MTAALPQVLHHWTSASRIASIRASGLKPSRGSVYGFHDDAAVCLTMTGVDPAKGWNASILHPDGQPACITIDVTKLDPRRFGPDLDSLLEEDTVASAEEDLEDPANHTLEMSLRETGNCRYRGVIPPAAFVAVRTFPRPHWWK